MELELRAVVPLGLVPLAVPAATLTWFALLTAVLSAQCSCRQVRAAGDERELFPVQSAFWHQDLEWTAAGQQAPSQWSGREHEHERQHRHQRHRRTKRKHSKHRKRTAAPASERQPSGEEEVVKQSEDEARNRALSKYTRQALDLAVNRLQILESLDGQLREFVAAAKRRASEQRVCHLRLDFESRHLPVCLASAEFKSQVPPYMLNLYSQLMGESSSLAEAVRSMPYKSLVMRSFRQPAEERQGADVVVELSALGANMEAARADERNHYDAPGNSRPATATAAQYAAKGDELAAGDERDELRPPSCRAGERRLPAHRRSELCYWFHIGEQMRMKLNGSLRSQLAPVAVAGASAGRTRAERVLEAELHVFKLLPEWPPLGADDINAELGAARNKTGASQLNGHQRRRHQQSSPATQHSQRPQHRTASASFYHLKTNLLEVSLYQILPKKRTSSGATSSHRMAEPANDHEFPLRLLDIRRIDLGSSGWETFYVKRAVDDWIRDARLNLGLVIKARSMFEEPVRLGLIRFADLNETEPPTADEEASGHESDSAEFGVSHQPILVIYSTDTDRDTDADADSAADADPHADREPAHAHPEAARPHGKAPPR